MAGQTSAVLTLEQQFAAIQKLPLEQRLAALMERRDAGEVFLAANPNHVEGLAAYKRYVYELMGLCLDYPDLAEKVSHKPGLASRRCYRLAGVKEGGRDEPRRTG